MIKDKEIFYPEPVDAVLKPQGFAPHFELFWILIPQKLNYYGVGGKIGAL